MVSEGVLSQPWQIADVVLGAVVRGPDAVYIEPDDGAYVIRFESRASPISSERLDSRLARAVIARLALIGELDLASGRTASAVVHVRCGDHDRDVVVTIRHGDQLRADLAVLPDLAASRSSQRLSQPIVGDTINHYEIVQHLGEGGMGTVFRVRHRSLEREYALKVLREVVSRREPDADQRFLREARFAARIRHPHIVDVFDFGHLPNGRPYLVMELLEGESLADLAHRGPVAGVTVLAIAKQLASALVAAHGRGIVHADVTPSNVLLSGTAPLAVKLVDFGLALAAGDRPIEPDGFVLGTPHYISPEQLRGLPATEYSDQYGLGAVLFHLITGEPPYHDDDLRKLCHMHLDAPIPPLRSPLGPLPARLPELITRCLQKSPQMRFPDMRAVAAALQDVEQVAQRRDWTRWLER
jgi:serine/threonine protein kinase